MRRDPVEVPDRDHVHRLGPEGTGPVTRLWRWVRLHPNVIAYLGFAGLNLAAFRALDAERDDRERDRCVTAVETRVEQEAMWVSILTRAGVDEPTIDILRDGYDDLPEPAGC